MKIWYLRVNHIPISNGSVSGPAIPWAHGKNGAAVAIEELTAEWVVANGYKTKAAALRAAGAANDWDDPYWAHTAPCACYMCFPDRKLRYKIYRCYEIVIMDEDGNPVRESDYCYTTRADAEALARREIEILEG